ncbi:unnamed protein product, partial [marine sediment metagenome]
MPVGLVIMKWDDRAGTEIFFRILDEEQLPFSEKFSIIASETSTGVFRYQFNTSQYSLNGG